MTAETKEQITVRAELTADVLIPHDGFGAFSIFMGQLVGSIDTGQFAGSDIVDTGRSIVFTIKDDQRDGDPIRVALPMADLFAAALVARDKALAKG